MKIDEKDEKTKLIEELQRDIKQLKMSKDDYTKRLININNELDGKKEILKILLDSNEN